MATRTRSTTAAVVEEPGAPFVLHELELDDPRDGEVLIDIDAAGICHTDLVMQDGALPMLLPGVLGHEAVGHVASVGPGVTDVAHGDRVALSFAACGHCPHCRSSHPSACGSFFLLNSAGGRADGSTALRRGDEPVHSHFFGQSSFATRAVVLASTLVPMPDDVPDEIAAPLGCGVQTGAGGVLNVLDPEPGSTLLVFGAGTVGLAAIAAAVVAGCGRIIAVDLHDSRLEVARDLGATDVIKAGDIDIVGTILGATAGGADYVLETTGAPAVIPNAVYCAAPRGTVGLIGAPPLGTTLDVDVSAVVSFSRTIKGVMEGDAVPREFLPQLVELWRDGRLPLERIVTTFDFDRINEAAAASRSGEVIKPVLRT